MDVLERLKRLYALAMSEAPGTENEARNAAMLLLKTAKAHGVTISFQVRREVPPPPQPYYPPAPAPRSPFYGGMPFYGVSGIEEILRAKIRAQDARMQAAWDRVAKDVAEREEGKAVWEERQHRNSQTVKEQRHKQPGFNRGFRPR